MDSKSRERRQAPRLPLAITVELSDERGFSLHSTSDLSAGGAYFDRAIPHPVGARVSASFTLPGDERPIVCEAEVVNVPHQNQFGMGVHFLNLGEADRRRLTELTEIVSSGGRKR